MLVPVGKDRKPPDQVGLERRFYSLEALVQMKHKQLGCCRHLVYNFFFPMRATYSGLLVPTVL